jgi:hypothetical protein
MKKHTQWLQYLAAFAAPTAPALQGEATVSPQAAAKVNTMAETHAAAPDQADQLQEWLQIIWVQWIQTWTQIIVVEQVDVASAQGNDFDSYASLLDRVKNEA